MTDIKSIVSTAVGGFDGNQAALAHELGVTRATVSRWMSGQSIPDEGSCLRLAKITGHLAADVFRAAGRDTSLLPGDPQLMADAQVQARLQQWARRLAELSDANRSIVLGVVDDVVKTLSRRLSESEGGEQVADDLSLRRRPDRQAPSIGAHSPAFTRPKRGR